MKTTKNNQNQKDQNPSQFINVGNKVIMPKNVL